MRRLLAGLALIFAFVFGAAAVDVRDLVNTGETTEEGAASEERDEELLRSRAESSRWRARKKKGEPFPTLTAAWARPIKVGRWADLRPVLPRPPIGRVQRQPLLQIFQI